MLFGMTVNDMLRMRSENTEEANLATTLLKKEFEDMRSKNDWSKDRMKVIRDLSERICRLNKHNERLTQNIRLLRE